MRKSVVRTALLLMGSVVAAGFIALPAHAATFPKQARVFTAWMARAFDQCTPSSMTVITVGLPATGCVAANSVTDSSTLMNYAKVRITTKGRIKLVGRGFTFGDVVRVRLQLRVSKTGVVTKHPPSTNQTVTFADVTVDCPGAPDAFTVRPNGAILASTDLAACLAPNPALAGGSGTNNIEILGASLVSVISGKEMARSGLVR